MGAEARRARILESGVTAPTASRQPSSTFCGCLRHARRRPERRRQTRRLEQGETRTDREHRQARDRGAHDEVIGRAETCERQERENNQREHDLAGTANRENGKADEPCLEQEELDVPK